MSVQQGARAGVPAQRMSNTASLISVVLLSAANSSWAAAPLPPTPQRLGLQRAAGHAGQRCEDVVRQLDRVGIAREIGDRIHVFRLDCVVKAEHFLADPAGQGIAALAPPSTFAPGPPARLSLPVPPYNVLSPSLPKSVSSPPPP